MGHRNCCFWSCIFPNALEPQCTNPRYNAQAVRLKNMNLYEKHKRERRKFWEKQKGLFGKGLSSGTSLDKYVCPELELFSKVLRSRQVCLCGFGSFSQNRKVWIAMALSDMILTALANHLTWTP